MPVTQEAPNLPSQGVFPDEPEIKKTNTGIYVSLAVLAVLVLSAFIVYTQFLKKETWTDTSYTNWKLGFSMDIPEGWEKYDFTLKEKAMLKMEKFAYGGQGKILCTLAHDTRRDTAY